MDSNTLGMLKTLGFDGGMIGVLGVVVTFLFKKLNNLERGLSNTMAADEIRSYVDEVLKEHLEIIDYKLNEISARLNEITKVTVKKN